MTMDHPPIFPPAYLDPLVALSDLKNQSPPPLHFFGVLIRSFQ
eukprot:CAMPEP_0119010694 /NCGR_PEP_ID=MMETSP1176-20130426/5183_1 /TAXON_ID=265551 /ORGANISM="Synedropsis recta cf, Strain CCMP1620" /LENGTH=42 /DNA_ID= /DNA_START= /DNA_END= /DNA_ORIENTATION=